MAEPIERRTRNNEDNDEVRPSRGARRERSDHASREDHHDRTAKADGHTRTVVDESLQRSKYGGFHFGAAFFGWLVSTGMAVLLIALLSAAGGGFAALTNSNASQVQQNAAELGIVGAIVAAVVLAGSYYAGGYVAGRMSRFNGARQGVGVWVIGVIIALVLAIAGGLVGSNLDAVRQVSLPNLPVDGGALTTGGIIALVGSAILTLLAAIAGGKVGERFHRKVDRAGVTRD